MSDPLHARICLTGPARPIALVSLFLVPEPRVHGANVLHLLEQEPGAEAARPDPNLVRTLQARTLPDARVRLLAFGPADPERPPVGSHDMRILFHDHYIAGDPLGLDTGDPAELARLAVLPEHPIGPRRVDDFQDRSIRQAMLAVYRYFDVDQCIPLMYHGYADPAAGWLALRTALA
jgi:hypothetical protein